MLQNDRDKNGRFVKGYTNKNKGKINKECRICVTCGKDFYCYRSQKNKFCCKQCYYNSLRGKSFYNSGQFKKGDKKLGKDNTNWKGGRTKSGEYIMIKSYGHPNSYQSYVLEHRIIAEKYLRRYLNKKEVIHHIDGDTVNNNLDNLYLFENNSTHMKYHFSVKSKKCKPITKSNLKQFRKVINKNIL